MSVSRGTVRLVSDLVYDLPSGSEDEGEAESDSDSIQSQDILEEINEVSSSSECEDNPGTSTVITTNRAQSQKEQLQALSTKDLVWESKPFSQQGDLPFTGSEPMPDDVKNLNTPYQFFSYFFDDDLIAKIVAETMLYSVQKDPSRPFSISSNEVKKYLGILILTSVVKISNIRAYWSPTLGIHLIQNTMSVNTFERIRQFLHFNDTSIMPPSDHPDHDKLYRLRPVISAIRQKFLSVPMEQRLAVDEQICATKVKHHLKQYNPSKPHKWGFKVYLLSGESGFCNDFEIYTDREKIPVGAPDLGACANIVVRLSQSIPNEKQFSIYFDNYFTTIKLLLYLKQRGIQSLGTFRSNRFPAVHLVGKKERGKFIESTTKVNDEEICAVSWFDNKVVNL